MEDLLAQYSLTEIVSFLVVFALATKAVITFYDWAFARIKKYFDKEYNTQNEKQDIETRLKRHSASLEDLHQNQRDLYEAVSALTKKVDLLIDSDKDDIKSFLTQQHHHFCYQKGWIDDYSLECCQRRYAHYKEEGGNSFIAGFMDELSALPKQPPTML